MSRRSWHFEAAVGDDTQTAPCRSIAPPARCLPGLKANWLAAVTCAVSPGRMPGRITGGLPVYCGGDTQASSRKSAGMEVPCQSNAVRIRRARSPPTATKVAQTRISTSARSAPPDRVRRPAEAGLPAVRFRADAGKARSTWARHRATDHRIVLGRGDGIGDGRGRLVRRGCWPGRPAGGHRQGLENGPQEVARQRRKARPRTQ